MFSNPKRAKATAEQKETWFDFYAGYSAAFVRDVLSHILAGVDGHVLDPWNGSGTTTTAAHDLGFKATGIDLNPVMAVVARAKLLSAGVAESVLPLTDDILGKARLSGWHSGEGKTDPLEEWFSPAGARVVRAVADSIATLLTPMGQSTELYKESSISHISDLAAFFLVALFRTVRAWVRKFQASNPTWIKKPKSHYQRVRPTFDTVAAEFRRNVEAMMLGITATEPLATARIAIGSSDDLPLDDNTVHAVVSSPPYCTRIDYPVATKPELAVLGCPLTTEFDTLRRRMVGGPVVTGESVDPCESWGRGCIDLLESIRTHRTKGSESYYYKVFVQYFKGLFRSLKELDRVLVSGGACVLVVQDSHYKELHVDVAARLTEMVALLGWNAVRRLDFPTSLVMARMNPRVQKYRSSAKATESILWFKTAS